MDMKKHFLSTPLVIATIAFAIAAFLFLIDTSINEGVSSSNPLFFDLNKDKTVACTLEAKQCPDGSYVGRSGPKCEFAECPATNTNAPTNRNLNTSDELIAGRELYLNADLGFSFQYPTSFGEFTDSTDGPGFRGRGIAVAAGTDGTISISVLDKPYDPATIVGAYGPVEAQYIKAITFGTRAGSIFMVGDAGCGAQEALTSLTSTQTLWISFSDCLEDLNTSEAMLYDDLELIRSILATFVFTD